MPFSTAHQLARRYPMPNFSRQRFGVFTVDLREGALIGPAGPIEVRAKTWRLLDWLIRHPAQLISRDQLLDVVWAGVRTAPVQANNLVSELRSLLRSHDPDREYIENLRGRGYRLVTPVIEVDDEATDPALQQAAVPGLPFGLHGHSIERAELARRSAAAERGELQVVLLNGGAGIGKSALVDQLTADLVGDARSTWRSAVARGLKGATQDEAYQPIVRMLEALAATFGDGPFHEAARRFAPWWLLKILWLVAPDERAQLLSEVQGSGALLPLRQVRSLLEYLASQAPLLLVFEDIHLYDIDTLELLVGLIQDPPRGPILVVATFDGPVSASNRASLRTLKGILDRLHHSAQMTLAPMSDSAVHRYLAARFGVGIADQIGGTVAERTGGIPMFVVAAGDWLDTHTNVAESALVRLADVKLFGSDDAVPVSMARVIEEQLQRFDNDHKRLLETMAVVGEPVSVDDVAGLMNISFDLCRKRLARLAKAADLVRLVRNAAPADTPTSLYWFINEGVPGYLRDNIDPEFEVQITQALVDRLSARGRRSDAWRLARHHQEMRRYPEALKWAERAFEYFLQIFALTNARRACELVLQLQPHCRAAQVDAEAKPNWQLWLGNLRYWAAGNDTAGANAAFIDARDAAAEAGDEILRFRSELGVISTALHSLQTDRASEALETVLEFAVEPDSDIRAVAHTYAAMVRVQEGRVENAIEHCRIATKALPFARPDVPLMQDLEKILLLQQGAARMASGNHRGWNDIESAIARSEADQETATLALAHTSAAQVSVWACEWERVRHHAKAGLEVSLEPGFGWQMWACRLLLLWMDVRENTIPHTQLVEAVDESLQSGHVAVASLSFYSLAESLTAAGEFVQAHQRLDRAFGATDGISTPLLWQARARAMHLAPRARIEDQSARSLYPSAALCLRRAKNLAEDGGAELMVQRTQVVADELGIRIG